MSAAEIMDLTGHNKWTLFPILHRLIRENKITKKNLRYAPTGYSDKLILTNKISSFVQTPLDCQDCGTIGIFNLDCGLCRLRILRQEHARSYGSRWQKGTVGLMEIGKPTIVDVKEPANEGQIGGQHYKRLAIQPWDYILQNDIGYMEGSVIKYISRWRNKNGLEDLYKCRHFLNKLIEHEEKK
jgi:hypothetical protein